jgi:ribosomal protein S20
MRLAGLAIQYNGRLPAHRFAKDNAEKALRESQRVIDRIVAKGVLHRNAGDRHKSRLAHALKAMK